MTEKIKYTYVYIQTCVHYGGIRFMHIFAP